MRLITGTGLALLAAFAVGVAVGSAWLMIGAIVGVIAWSTASDRATRWTTPKGWYRP